MASAAGRTARGPLSLLLGSAGGQWTLLGAGTAAMFPEKIDSMFGTSLQQSLAALTSHAGQLKAADMVAPSAPIVIHTTSSSRDGNGKGSIVTTIITYSVGAGAIWVVYMCASNYLPDWCKDMLPVSRKFFDRAVNNLGKGILNVKDALSKQIFNLGRKQDDLSKKQDATHREVVYVKGELGDARQDLMELNEALGRCEGQLDSAEQLQLYTNRGVKLLVRCIAGVMPGNDRIISELLQFTKEGEKYDNFKKSGQDNQHGSPRSSMARQQIKDDASSTTSSRFVIKARDQQTYVSPEDECHPVTPALTAKDVTPSVEQVESMENLNELMALVRDGKIQTTMAH